MKRRRPTHVGALNPDLVGPLARHRVGEHTAEVYEDPATATLWVFERAGETVVSVAPLGNCAFGASPRLMHGALPEGCERVSVLADDRAPVAVTTTARAWLASTDSESTVRVAYLDAGGNELGSDLFDADPAEAAGLGVEIAAVTVAGRRATLHRRDSGDLTLCVRDGQQFEFRGRDDHENQVVSEPPRFFFGERSDDVAIEASASDDVPVTVQLPPGAWFAYTMSTADVVVVARRSTSEVASSQVIHFRQERRAGLRSRSARIGKLRRVRPR